MLGNIFQSLPDWDSSFVEHAACKEKPIEWWFPLRAWAPQDYADAKQYCDICPVVDRCAQYAINNQIAEGMWGGLMPHQRQQQIKAMKKAAKK